MTNNFKPLPSDLIQDPEMWPEWELTQDLIVIRKKDKKNDK